MLYIIGGASRAGKSILSRRIAAHHGISYLNLDFVMAGLIDGAPALGIRWEDSERIKAEKMWPVMSVILKNLAANTREPYLVESFCLLPEFFDEIRGFKPDVQGCWLGYPNATVEQKLREVEEAEGLSWDWLNEKSPEHRRWFVGTQIGFSKEIENGCNSRQLPFVDTSHGFEQALAHAEHLLMTEKEAGRA